MVNHLVVSESLAKELMTRAWIREVDSMLETSYNKEKVRKRLRICVHTEGFITTRDVYLGKCNQILSDPLIEGTDAKFDRQFYDSCIFFFFYFFFYFHFLLDFGRGGFFGLGGSRLGIFNRYGDSFFYRNVVNDQAADDFGHLIGFFFEAFESGGFQLKNDGVYIGGILVFDAVGQPFFIGF